MEESMEYSGGVDQKGFGVPVTESEEMSSERKYGLIIGFWIRVGLWFLGLRMPLIISESDLRAVTNKTAHTL